MDRIYFKGATEDDYEDYYRVRCTPTDLLWNGYKEKPNKDKLKEVFMSRLETNPLTEVKSGRIYLIKKVDDNSTIGFIHMLKLEDGIEIGCTILDDYQGFGYGTEAINKMAKIAKDFGDIVYVKIREDNIASQKSSMKAGFIKTDELSIRKAPMGDYVMRKYIYDNKEV